MAVSATARRQYGLVLPALVVLAGALFLLQSRSILDAPFGDSHDGRNAAVWVAGARSIVEHGVVGSRLGARSPELGTYADHPPLILWETAIAHWLGRGSTLADRAPAWIGSLAALALLAKLLAERGLRPAAAGVAVLLAATTPMFLVYGSMLDTPIIALPVALGLLLLWQRAAQGQPVRWWALAGLGAAATLASWQALLVAGAVATWGLVGLVRRTGQDRRIRAAAAGGFLAGLAVLVGWMFWAGDGSIRPIIHQYLFRSGHGAEKPPGLHALISGQLTTASSMFGPPILLFGLLGVVLALRDRRTRLLTITLLAVTIPYTLAFPLGAANHDYWNYWYLLPLALGLAVAAERLLAVLRTIPAERVLAIGGAAAATGLAAVIILNPPLPELLEQRGIAAGRTTSHMTLPASQPVAFYAGAVGEPPKWLAFSERRPTEYVRDPGAFAATNPTALVLVGRMQCAGLPSISYRFEPATAIAARPPVTSCHPG